MITEILSLGQGAVSSINGFITEAMNGEKLIAAAITASILGSLLWLVRSIPKRTYDFINRWAFFTYQIEYRQGEGRDMLEKVAAKFEYELQKKAGRRRPISRLTAYKQRLVESLADGSFYFFLEGCLVRVSRQRVTNGSQQGEKSSASINSSRTINLSITCMRYNRDKMLAILNKSASEYIEPGVYQNHISSWGSPGARCERIRSLTNIPPMAIDASLKNEIDTAIDVFLKNREEAKVSGLQNKLTIIFHGEPGSGKSELCSYVAHRLKTSLFVTNGISITNSNAVLLQETVKMARDNISEDEVPVVMLDDFDTFLQGLRRRSARTGHDAPAPSTASGDNVEEDEEQTPALGQMLAALQSPVSIDDCVVMFTTNHLEKIDPAMYRSGRITKLLRVGRMSPQSIMEYYSMVYGQQWPKGLEIKASMRACDVSSYYEANKGDPENYVQCIVNHKLAADEAFIKEVDTSCTV